MTHHSRLGYYCQYAYKGQCSVCLMAVEQQLGALMVITSVVAIGHVSAASALTTP